MSAGYALVGVADPGGRAMGFLIPVFRLHPSNSLFVQRTSADGEITGFDPVDLQRLEILGVADAAAQVGDSARWAFAFGRGDVILGNGKRGRKALERRLDEAPLNEMPALAFEVAEFLGLTTRRAELASRTFKRLARTSEAAANRWRDLSVLTPDLRAALTARLGADFAKGVVATSERRTITIGRHGRPGTRVEEDIRAVAEAVLVVLEPLYGPGWKVRFARVRDLADHPQPPDALVYVPQRRLDGLLHEIAGSRSLRVEGYPERKVAEFALAVQRLGRPGFVVGEAQDDERLQAAAADLGMDLVAISMTPPAAVSRPLLDEPSSLPTILVPTPSGRPGTPGRSPFRAGSVVQAMAAALAIIESRDGPGTLPGRSVLLRARGLGPDPDTDAWLAVQDRAWALGLDAYEALRVGPTIRRIEDRGLGADWAAHGFYRQDRPIDGIADLALAAMRTEAVALVPVTEPDENAETRRVLAIRHLLERQGWEFQRSRSDAPGPRAVSGARWEFELDPRRRPLPPKWRIEPLLEQPLRDIAIVAPSPEAGPGAILARLFGYGELAASVRDLVRLPADRATPHSLLGAQLRRLATAMPSRARSQFVALLIHDALTSGYVHDLPADLLNEIVRHPHLGTRMLLGLRRTVTTADGVQTDVHPALRDDGHRAWEGHRVCRPFRLLVQDDGVAITGLEGAGLDPDR